MAAGVPLYFLLAKWRPEKLGPKAQTVTHVLQKLTMCVPEEAEESEEVRTTAETDNVEMARRRTVSSAENGGSSGHENRAFEE